MRLCLLVFLGSTACLPDLGGQWSGECHFEDESYDERSFVLADVTSGRGNRVEGNLDVSMFDGRKLTGPFSGIRSDTFIELSANLPTQEGTFIFSADADLDEDEMSGSCTLRVPGGSNGSGLSGELLLER